MSQIKRNWRPFWAALTATNVVLAVLTAGVAKAAGWEMLSAGIVLGISGVAVIVVIGLLVSLWVDAVRGLRPKPPKYPTYSITVNRGPLSDAEVGRVAAHHLHDDIRRGT